MTLKLGRKNKEIFKLKKLCRRAVPGHKDEGRGRDLEWNPWE